MVRVLTIAAELTPRLSWLSGPWLVIPPALLFALSPLDPACQFRHLVSCLPAVAMLAGAGPAVLSR
jgi:mannosyltransferase